MLKEEWTTKFPTEPGKYIARINYNGELVYPVYAMKLDKKGCFWFLGRDIADKINDPDFKIEWAPEK